MAQTKLNFRQLVGKILNIGSTQSGDAGLLTIYRGDAPVAQTTLEVQGAATIEGSLSIGGDLNITGSINEQDVTNLNVADKTIRVNRGGAGGSANGSGLEVEAGGAVIGKVAFDSTSPTLFKIGDGTTMSNLVDSSTAQTLTNKTLQGAALTGNSTAPTAPTGTNNTQIATTAFVQDAISGVSAGIPTTYLRATPIAGTQDGSNKTFAIGDGVATGSEQVFLNGQLLAPGAANDYVLSGMALTFQAAQEGPLASDVLRAYGVY